MPRWPTVTARQHETLAKRVLAQVRVLNGSIQPDDVPAVGRPALVALAEACSLGPSQAFAAVNTMTAQPWMVPGLGVPATMTASATAWLVTGRHELAHALRVAGGYDAGSLPPKPGGRPRGRPIGT